MKKYFHRIVDDSMKAVLTAKLYVDTPYHTGDDKAMCLSHVVCDIIIDHIDGAKGPNDSFRKRVQMNWDHRIKGKI